MTARRLSAEHGVICAMPQEFFGYFGWPSIARLDDDTLVVVASGLRTDHVCPFGRTVLCLSRDLGRTWTSPRVINDTPLDDRDAGVICLGGRRILITWFSSDTRPWFAQEWMQSRWRALPVEQQQWWQAGMANMTDEAATRFEGAWLRVSDDAGETWGQPVRVPVNSPHGPILLRSGALLYFAKLWEPLSGLAGGPEAGQIVAMASLDEGQTWTLRGTVPLVSGTIWANYHEAHVVELPDGRLIGAIRLQSAAGPEGDVTRAGLDDFSVVLTESGDGGHTWATPRSVGILGSPPHLLRHSSGTLILTYGYRKAPFGQRVALSRDEGKTWEADFILRDDGPDADLGYPATVELPDGDLFTVYYQKPGSTQDRCGLLGSPWRLDEFT